MAYEAPTSDEIVKNVKTVLRAAGLAMAEAQAALADARLMLNKIVVEGISDPTYLNAALQAEMTSLKTNQDAMVTYLLAQAVGVK